MTAPTTHEVQMRWQDLDELGHVNHNVVLTYLEEGRDAFLGARGIGRAGDLGAEEQGAGEAVGRPLPALALERSEAPRVRCRVSVDIEVGLIVVLITR